MTDQNEIYLSLDLWDKIMIGWGEEHCKFFPVHCTPAKHSTSLLKETYVGSCLMKELHNKQK